MIRIISVEYVLNYSKFLHLTHFKASKQLPSLPQSELCRNCASSPSPYFPFPFFQQNPKKLKSNPLHLMPSLKSVAKSVIFSPIDYLLLRLTRREPSPVLIGLAMRLSVVWCGPRTLSFQPETNLGSNRGLTLGSDYHLCSKQVSCSFNRVSSSFNRVSYSFDTTGCHSSHLKAFWRFQRCPNGVTR